MPKIDETRPFIAVRIAVLTVSDTRTLQDDKSGATLAELIIDHDNFPKAFVNRMWAHFLGRGFSNPIDDFNEQNSVAHPELLDELANKFKNYGYDQKELIRWICNSQPFVSEQRRRYPPAVIELADEIVHRHRDIVKKHLAELVVSDNGSDRTDAHAWAAQIDQEETYAGVTWFGVRVRADERE